MAGLPIPLSFPVTNAASTVGLTAKAPRGAECWAERPSSPHTPRLFHSAGEFRFSKALMQKSKATSIQSPSMMPEGVLLHSEASGKHRGRGHSLGLVHFTRWVRTGTWIGRLPGEQTSLQGGAHPTTEGFVLHLQIQGATHLRAMSHLADCPVITLFFNQISFWRRGTRGHGREPAPSARTLVVSSTAQEPPESLTTASERHACVDWGFTWVPHHHCHFRSYVSILPEGVPGVGTTQVRLGRGCDVRPSPHDCSPRRGEEATAALSRWQRKWKTHGEETKHKF